MDKKRKSEDPKRRRVAAVIICAVLIAAAGAGIWYIQDIRNMVEVASSHVDPELVSVLEEDETPLASAPKVTTKTTKSSKTTKKIVKLSKAATKTYTSKLPKKTKKTTKTVKSSTKTVKTETTAVTEVTEKYTRNSRNKAVTTKVTTTVKTTTTVIASAPASSGPTTTTIDKCASKMNAKIIDAWKKIGFSIVIDPSVSYAGHFDAKGKRITLVREDETIYHEMGHFLGYMAGNYDTGSKFKAVYNEEKDKYTGFNKAYVIQDPSEYFAESLRDYTLNPAALKYARPKTYASIEEAIQKLTASQIRKMQLIVSMY